ncbi:MAG: phosphate acyltransferase [Pseudomonadota bacterium]
MSTNAFLYHGSPECPAELLSAAKSKPKMRIAVAAAGGALPIRAIKAAVIEGLAQAILFGPADEIAHELSNSDMPQSSVEIIDQKTDEDAANAAAKACGEGIADVLMKGALHTDVFMKAAISRANGLRTGARFVHLFALYPPTGGAPLLVSDAAVNVAPDGAALQAALTNMITVFHKLGTSRPKIALLSATEHAIPSVPSSVDMEALQTWAEGEALTADVRGPLALDLILSTEAAKIKNLEDDAVAGRADGVIVPDLVSGNVLFKSLVYLAGATAAGVITGAKVPILLTSRADPPAARLASIALASLLRD